MAQTVKNLPAVQERPGFNPWVGKICWRRKQLTTPIFWPGEFHGLYGPGGCKESDTTEWLNSTIILHAVYNSNFLCYPPNIPCSSFVSRSNAVKFLALHLPLVFFGHFKRFTNFAINQYFLFILVARKLRPNFLLIPMLWTELCPPQKKNYMLKPNPGSVMSDSLWPHGLYSPWNSPGQNIGMGSLSLLQGIFPTRGSNPGLPHCRRILYQLSHKGSVSRKNR